MTEGKTNADKTNKTKIVLQTRESPVTSDVSICHETIHKSSAADVLILSSSCDELI